MHFIFDLIRKILRGKELGERVVLWGDGRQKRELIYRDDFVALLEAAIDKGGDELLINIGSGEERSIREFAAEICSIVGYPADKIEYDASKYVGVTSKCLNVEKLRSLVPDYRPVPLRDGLKKTIDWFYKARAFER
jgi:GDP-L-fucose synthase